VFATVFAIGTVLYAQWLAAVLLARTAVASTLALLSL